MHIRYSGCVLMQGLYVIPAAFFNVQVGINKMQRVGIFFCMEHLCLKVNDCFFGRAVVDRFHKVVYCAQVVGIFRLHKPFNWVRTGGV